MGMTEPERPAAQAVGNVLALREVDEACAPGFAHDEGELMWRVISAEHAARKHAHGALEERSFFWDPAGWVRHASSWFGSGVAGRLYTLRDAAPQRDSARGRIGAAGPAGRLRPRRTLMSAAKIVKLAETEVVSCGPLAHYQPIIGDDDGTTPVRTGIQTPQPGYVAPVHSHPYLEILHILDGTAEVWPEG